MLSCLNNLRLSFLSSYFSSDVVWEFKPKKKSRWKPLSIKEAEIMEEKFKDYLESGAVDKEIFDLENGFQVKYCNYFYSVI